MGYDSQIKKNVRQAFKAVGDLATTVTLRKVSDTAFDFSTQAVSGEIDTISIKGVITQKRRTSSGEPGGVPAMDVMFIAEDMPDPTVAYTLTKPDGSMWRITPPYSNDGFVVTASLTRVAK